MICTFDFSVVLLFFVLLGFSVFPSSSDPDCSLSSELSGPIDPSSSSSSSSSLLDGAGEPFIQHGDSNGIYVFTTSKSLKGGVEILVLVLSHPNELPKWMF